MKLTQQSLDQQSQKQFCPHFPFCRGGGCAYRVSIIVPVHAVPRPHKTSPRMTTAFPHPSPAPIKPEAAIPALLVPVADGWADGGPAGLPPPRERLKHLRGGGSAGRCEEGDDGAAVRLEVLCPVLLLLHVSRRAALARIYGRPVGCVRLPPHHAPLFCIARNLSVWCDCASHLVSGFTRVGWKV